MNGGSDLPPARFNRSQDHHELYLKLIRWELDDEMQNVIEKLQNWTKKKLIENGISVGFGFKFGTTGNQIDFSFRNGTRSITEGQKELFKEITIGVSLGDMWFLRRRAKQ